MFSMFDIIFCFVMGLVFGLGVRITFYETNDRGGKR